MDISKLTAVPTDIVEARSIGHNGVLFKRKDGSLWMHGTLGHKLSKWDDEPDDDVVRTKPVKLDWNGKIIFSDDYIIFKANDDEYYAVGSFPWADKYHDKPVKVPIDGIVKVFAFHAFIYICTATECFVAGYNRDGQLGIGDPSIEWQKSLIKVDWYPIEILNGDFMVAIKMKDGKWYGVGLMDEIHGFSYNESFAEQPFTEEQWFARTDELDEYGHPKSVLSYKDRHIWYPRLLSESESELWEERLETWNHGYDSNLCPRCKFDIIDLNIVHSIWNNCCDSHDNDDDDENEGSKEHYHRCCLLCHYELGHLSGKDERRALWELKHLDQDNLPKIQTFLTGIFEPLQDDLKEFNRKLTCFNIDHLIKAVKFENRLLVKRLIHDKLLEYMHPWFMDVRHLKENNYTTYELPLEPNDLGVLDWRSCSSFNNKLDFNDLIDKVNNKDKVKVLDVCYNTYIEKKLDDLYRFITHLPVIEILIIDGIREDDKFLTKLPTLKRIKMIRIKSNYFKKPDRDLSTKIILNSDDVRVEQFNERMKKYTHNYFPNYPKYFLDK
jgi:hypothetical protein